MTSRRSRQTSGRRTIMPRGVFSVPAPGWAPGTLAGPAPFRPRPVPWELHPADEKAGNLPPAQDGRACTRCFEWKPLGAFHKSRHGRDGREAQCKACRHAREHEHRQDPEVRERVNAQRRQRRQDPEAHEREREYYRRYNEANPEVQREAQRRYKEEHREELNAKNRERERRRREADPEAVNARHREYMRTRKAADPGYAERVRAELREYKRARRQRQREEDAA